MSDHDTDALPDIASLWNFQAPDASEAAFRAVLDAHQDADPVYLAEVRTQVARTFSLRARFDEAHALLDDVESTLIAGTRAELRYLLERGRTFNSAKRKAEATECFERAVQVASAIGEEALEIDALHMLAISDDERALHWNEVALERAESATEERARGWRGSLLNNLGWTTFAAGDLNRALDYFERAVKVRSETGAQPGLWIARWCVARTWRALGRLDEALAEQRAIAAERDDGADGYGQEEIAECLLALGRGDEATPHFARAWELLHEDPWLQRDEPERLARLKALSEARG